MTVAYDLNGDPVDTFTREGACHIAAQIVGYWRDRGEYVKIDIVVEKRPNEKFSHKNLYCVRSNLINGLPR